MTQERTAKSSLYSRNLHDDKMQAAKDLNFSDSSKLLNSDLLSSLLNHLQLLCGKYIQFTFPNAPLHISKNYSTCQLTPNDPASTFLKWKLKTEQLHLKMLEKSHFKTTPRDYFIHFISKKLPKNQGGGRDKLAEHRGFLGIENTLYIITMDKCYYTCFQTHSMYSTKNQS